MINKDKKMSLENDVQQQVDKLKLGANQALLDLLDQEEEKMKKNLASLQEKINEKEEQVLKSIQTLSPNKDQISSEGLQQKERSYLSHMDTLLEKIRATLTTDEQEIEQPIQESIKKNTQENTQKEKIKHKTKYKKRKHRQHRTR